MPSLTSRVESLLASAKKMDAWLEANGVDHPSFDADTLGKLPDELQDERWALANSANQLKQLIRGSELSIMDCGLSWVDGLALRVVYSYNLADAVPLDGTATYAEIAAKSGLNEDLCRRFMRLAMSNHLFAEDTPNCVRHTASSRHLVEDPGLQAAAGLTVEELAPASSKLIDVWETEGQEVADPAKSAFSKYNDAGTLYAVLASQPKRGQRFGLAMGYFTRGDSCHLRHLLASFDWASIDGPGAQVVDIGGGFGQISQYLARHTTNIEYVVQDLTHVTSRAPAMLPEDLQSRVKFATHDFFTPQPADAPPAAFLLRYILHNWADQLSIDILRALVPALRKGSKVLIYEYVLPDHPVTDFTGRFGFQMDAIMATFFNAQERTAVEFERLIKKAHPGYKLDKVTRPPGATMSMVEIGWSGDQAQDAS